MFDDGVITGKILLDHIQSSKLELKQDIRNLSTQFDSLEKRLDSLEVKVEDGFRDAREHREMLQIDLDATIRMQSRHERELAVISGRPLPEED